MHFCQISQDVLSVRHVGYEQKSALKLRILERNWGDIDQSEANVCGRSFAGIVSSNLYLVILVT